MNILFLCRNFYPQVGGVSVHVENVSKELIKKGFSVTVVSLQYDHSLSLSETYEKISIIRIPYHLIGSTIGVWKWIDKNKELFDKADIVHSHDVFKWILILKLRGLTNIYTTFHGDKLTKNIPLSIKGWKKIVHKMSRGTIALGSYLEDLYGISSNIVIYGATDFKQMISPGSKKNILVYGRLSKENSMGMIIQGLKIVKDAYPEIDVTFLGDGDYSWQAKEVGDVLGFHEKFEQHIENGHWVITSSYSSILDAIASGRRVFSLYSSALKKAYLDTHPLSNGISISGSAEEFAEKFIDSYKNYQEHTIENNIFEQWAQQQTWGKLASQYISLWQDSSYTFSYKKVTNDLSQS